MMASPAAYDRVAAAAAAAFQTWREVPAPKRGEVVRDLGNALRELKEPLGDLVAARDGQDTRRRPRRGSGDDRHLRLRDRPVAAALRPHHRVGAARPSHDGTVAPAGRGGRHHRVQLPGRRVVLERGPGRGLRRQRRLEAGRAHAAHGARRAAHRQPRDGRPRPHRRVHAGGRRRPDHRRGHAARPNDCRSSLSRDRRRSDVTSRRQWPGALARRFSSSAATTPSSSLPMPTSTWPRGRSCSARSAPRASAAPRRGGSSRTRASPARSSIDWRAPTGRSTSATRCRPGR